jgi:5-oxoprolinase (ATP-hydrolysing) subunit C
MLSVLSPGPLTLLEDLGRPGWTHRGVTPSGAMDRYAYLWTQKLLGDTHGNALEILLGGLRLKVGMDTQMAVCGADLGLQINGQPAPLWQTLTIHKRDQICFTRRVQGMRAYLALKGGFEVPQIQQGVSTTLRELKGKPLQQGDTLAYTPAHLTATRRVPRQWIPVYPEHLRLRVVLGYQAKAFDTLQRERFLTQTYTLSGQMNRMGYRLEGVPITPPSQGILSEGIAMGAIQIPPDGQPIILLNERQTLGGYPKIGSVLPIDCYRLSQLPIGSQITFAPIAIDEAQAKMRTFDALFAM